MIIILTALFKVLLINLLSFFLKMDADIKFSPENVLFRWTCLSYFAIAAKWMNEIFIVRELNGL